MVSLLCKFAALVVIAVQALALCHADAGQACQVVAEATAASCVCTADATHTPEECPSCSSGESKGATVCDGHSMPDGRPTIVPPAAFLPVALIGFDPTEFRAHAVPAFDASPPQPPSARLSLPLLI